MLGRNSEDDVTLAGQVGNWPSLHMKALIHDSHKESHDVKIVTSPPGQTTYDLSTMVFTVPNEHYREVYDLKIEVVKGREPGKGSLSFDASKQELIGRRIDYQNPYANITPEMYEEEYHWDRPASFGELPE